jgi:hypothetical protein
MTYDNYFWTELSYERHSYVSPNGEILIHIAYNAPTKTYAVEDKDFINLAAAKVFAIALLKRTGKIPDEDNDPLEEETA